MSNENKIVQGFMESKKLKYVVAVLLIIIFLLIILNVQFNINIAFPLILVIIVLFAIIVWMLSRKTKTKYIDAFEATKIIAKKVNEEYPELTLIALERDKIHVDVIDERLMLVQIDSPVNKVYGIEADTTRIFLIGSPDIQKHKRRYMQEKAYLSSLSSNIIAENVRDQLKKSLEE